MSSRLSAGDVKLLWISAGFGMLLLLATGLTTQLAQEGSGGIPSSYSSSPGGALAAYLLLSELNVPVTRSTDAPAFLHDVPAESVLILAEPSDLATAADRTALMEFVTRGGRILYCGASLEVFLKLPKTESMFTALKPYQAELPSGFTRGADTITVSPRARWTSSEQIGMRLYGSQNDPVVVAAKIGQGEVLWWASATPLTNARIDDVDNLSLFLNAVSSHDGTPRPIYWDEYFHGQQGTLWSYVAKTPIPWGMWQLGIVFAALMFAFSRRSGPVVLPAVRSRLSPLEFVDTMGNLYAHAGAASVAVEVPYRALRLQLARRMGRSSATPDRDLASAAVVRFSLPENEVADLLHQASQAARAKDLRGADALDLVRRLAGYSHHITNPNRAVGNRAQEKKK